MFSNLFPKENSLLEDNVEKYGGAGQATGDNRTRCMHFACWITEATVAHSEYVILIAFAGNNV